MNNLIKTTVSLILLTSVLLSASTAYAETIFIDEIFDFTVEYDVKYGEGAVGTGSSYIDLKLDIYRPTGPELPSLLPGITLIHGGGFTGGNKSHMSAFCEGFARRGWVATSIRYRLEGDNPQGQLKTPGVFYGTILIARTVAAFTGTPGMKSPRQIPMPPPSSRDTTPGPSSNSSI
jgi:hypothetical protein